jgi:hypothetical protein
MFTTVETLSVDQLADRMRRSLLPLDVFLQDCVIHSISSHRQWPECYIQVAINSNQQGNLRILLSIHRQEDGGADLEGLLRDKSVVLQTGDTGQPLGNFHDDPDHAGCFSAALDLAIADIKPESYLTIG